MINIWKKIKNKGKIFSCLAPMADVTDIAFRRTISKYSRHGKIGGGPDLFWTEFVSADGLASKEGRKKLAFMLRFSKNEKPIIAQIFGSNPENIKIACEYISKLGFDGIDINMGCPDRAVLKQGAGAKLITNPKLAREIIRKAKEGAPKMPISVKTRIGFNNIDYKNWLTEIAKENLDGLTIHLRTRKEMSLVPAHWEFAKDIVKTVRKIDKKVVLVANGDIFSLEEGKKKAKQVGFDGIMIGRGIFGNPWFFDSKRKLPPTKKEKLTALIEHLKCFEKTLEGYKNFAVMKKHFKAYAGDFDGAKEIRIKLMETRSTKEAIQLLKRTIAE